MAENDPKRTPKGWKIAELIGGIGFIVSLVAVFLGAYWVLLVQTSLELFHSDGGWQLLERGRSTLDGGVLGLEAFGLIYLVVRWRRWLVARWRRWWHTV